jgi:hypothetical protein
VPAGTASSAQSPGYRRASYVSSRCWSSTSSSRPRWRGYNAPPNIASLIHEGNLVWDVLETLRGMPTDTPDELAAWIMAIGKKLLTMKT